MVDLPESISSVFFHFFTAEKESNNQEKPTKSFFSMVKTTSFVEMDQLLFATDKKVVLPINCKSLWIKASVKCVNVNLNAYTPH